jgi:hypothetical protein
MSKKPSKPGKRGRPEQRVKMTGNWEDNVGDAMKIKRPATGWPKPDKRKKRAE